MTKKKTILASVGVLVLMVIGIFAVVGIFAILTVHAAPVAPLAKTVVLPSGSKSISLATDGSYIYYGSYAYGHIYKVDSVLGTYQQIYTASSVVHHWTSMTYWDGVGPYGNRAAGLYLVELGISNATMSKPGNLYQYHFSNSSLTLVATGVGSSQSSIIVSSLCLQYDSISGACTRNQSFLYAASGNRFFIIEWLGDVSPGQKGWWTFP